MTPFQMKTVVFFAMNGIVLTILSVIGLILYFYGPCLEPYVAGYVIHVEKPDHIFRGYVIKRESGREVEVGCFRLQLRKLAPAIPLKYAFEVEARLSEKIPVSAYLADDHHFQSESDFTTHPVGEKWNRDYCFEMPGTIADNQSIRVTGHAEHTRIVYETRDRKPDAKHPHGVAGTRLLFPFWRSITPAPEFLILAIHCYRDDGTIETAFKDCPAQPP